MASSTARERAHAWRRADSLFNVHGSTPGADGSFASTVPSQSSDGPHVAQSIPWIAHVIGASQRVLARYAKLQTKWASHWLTLRFLHQRMERRFSLHYNTFVLEKIRHTAKFTLVAEMLAGIVLAGCHWWAPLGANVHMDLAITRIFMLASIAAVLVAHAMEALAAAPQLITGALFSLRAAMLLLYLHALLQPAVLSPEFDMLGASLPFDVFVATHAIVYFHCCTFHFSGLRYFAACVVGITSHALFVGLLLFVPALRVGTLGVSVLIAPTAVLVTCAAAARSNEMRIKAEFLLKTEIAVHTSKADSLLTNMLPKPIVAQLQRGTPPSQLKAQVYDEVTVMVCRIVAFDRIVYSLSDTALLDLLHDVYCALDELLNTHPTAEKIEVSGRTYIAASGCPTPNPRHARHMAEFALDALNMSETDPRFLLADGRRVSLKIGLHCGPVVGGVVGLKNLSYKLFGNTVNTATRLCSRGKAGCALVSHALQRQLGRSRYEFRPPPLPSTKEDLAFMYLSRRVVADSSDSASHASSVAPPASVTVQNVRVSDHAGGSGNSSGEEVMSLLETGAAKPGEVVRGPAWSPLTLQFPDPDEECAYSILHNMRNRRTIGWMLLLTCAGGTVLFTMIMLRFDMFGSGWALAYLILPAVLAAWACMYTRLGVLASQPLQATIMIGITVGVFAFAHTLELNHSVNMPMLAPAMTTVLLVVANFVMRFQIPYLVLAMAFVLVCAAVGQAFHWWLSTMHLAMLCLWLQSACTFGYATYMRERGLRRNFLLLSEARAARDRYRAILEDTFPAGAVRRLLRGSLRVRDELPGISMCFVEILNLTPLATTMSPTQLVRLLNLLYSAFHEEVQRHEAHMVDAMGTSVAVAAGLPGTTTDHAVALLRFAASMLLRLETLHAECPGLRSVGLRFAVHSGAAGGGVVGSRLRPRYLVWGSTAVIACKLKALAAPGKVLVSEDTLALLPPRSGAVIEPEVIQLPLRSDTRPTVQAQVMQSPPARISTPPFVVNRGSPYFAEASPRYFSTSDGEDALPNTAGRTRVLPPSGAGIMARAVVRPVFRDVPSVERSPPRAAPQSPGSRLVAQDPGAGSPGRGARLAAGGK